MTNAAHMFSPEYLDEVFPSTRTDAFFDALFGGAEEGAYDIRLRFEADGPGELRFAFHLVERPGKCLVCNLTYGLPQVFSRHPVLAVGQVVGTLCARVGVAPSSWNLLPTRSDSRSLHRIPLVISLA